MSLPIFIRAIKFISCVFIAQLFILEAVHAEWTIDLSRRRQDIRHQELKKPTHEKAPEGFFAKLFGASSTANDVVILNTDKGFLPDTVRLMQGQKYRVHLVNVNEKESNVSFILDAFSEHHATYYGKVKSFVVEPKKEGVYSFQCPETSIEGRVVVYQPESQGPVKMRFPASE